MISHDWDLKCIGGAWLYRCYRCGVTAFEHTYEEYDPFYEQFNLDTGVKVLNLSEINLDCDECIIAEIHTL